MSSFILSLIFFLFQTLHAVAEADFSFDDFQKCQSEGADFNVIVKNVGQGSCTILKNNKNSCYCLIDAGTSSDTPLEIINRIAIELGMSEIHTDLPHYVNRLGTIISHSDKDHINIFSKLLNLNSNLLKRTDGFVLGDIQERYNGTEFLDYLIALLDAKKKIFVTEYIENRPLNQFSFLDSESAKQQTHLSVLCSNAGHGTSYHDHENTNSAIVQLCINKRNILIMGDASGFTTRRYMISHAHRESLKDTQLLIESHHGASDVEGANDGLWLSQIRPRHVAISAGFYGSDKKGYYHPNVEPFVDLIMIGFNEISPIDSFNYSDEHQIAIGVPDLRDREYVINQLSGFFENPIVAEKPQWLIFQTSLPIYNTATSGDLRYTFSSDGSLTDFSREY